MPRPLLVALCLLAPSIAGCSSSNDGSGNPPAEDAGPTNDAAAAKDAGATATKDSGGFVANDAGGGAPDTGTGADAGGPPILDAGAGAPDASVPDGAAPIQAIAIPMYMDPSAADWAQETTAASQVPLIIANPNSGPGSSVDSSYAKAIGTAHAANQTVVGYIHTSYGARAIADVEADIDSWYSFYPAIDGIFSDETATDASLVASYYAPLYAYVKKKSGRDVVVINPGTPPDESYMTASDIVMSYEDTYANYTKAQTPSWATNYPRTRFWHIVLSASQTEMTNAVTLARGRNVGLIYVTDQGPATAYSQLVTGAYWQAELAAVGAP